MRRLDWKVAIGSGIAAVTASVLILVGLTGSAGAQQRPPTPVAPAPAWPHQGSDLAPDPAVVFGVLPNGMRYAVMKNAQPPGNVSMRLLIEAGSMHEAPDQLGLAHFLEHLAFRGSTKVKDGELKNILERLGSAMGPDTNASTGPNQTIYMFNLAKSDDETVDTALMLLREVASELILSQDAMDAERGVILSEERARDGPGQRATDTLRALMFGDHPFGRSPIGTKEVLGTAKVDRVRAFYETYYRPERAALVIVGDLEPAALEAKIKALFSDWKGKGRDAANPPPMASGLESQARLFAEAGVTPQMMVLWSRQYEPKPDNVARARERLVEGLAFAALNNRYMDMTQSASPPFLAALAASSDVPDVVQMTQIVAVGPTQWEAALDTLVRVQRQAVEYGLRQDELERAITQQRTGLRAQVAAMPTRRTPALVNGLLGAVGSDRVYRSPAQTQAFYEEQVGTVTLAEVNAALRKAFQGQGPLAFMATPSPVEGGEPAFQQVFTRASTAPVTALAQVEAKPWPYTDFGPSGQVAERRTIDDVTLVRFANGVQLTVKPTDFNKDQIIVRTRIGYGMLDLPKDRMTAVGALGTRLIEGGLEALTAEEVTRTLTGKVVSSSSGVGPGGFILAGTTRPADFDLQLQVLTAYVTKPGWRADGLDAGVQFINTMYRQADTLPMSLFGLHSGALLRSGDARFKAPTPEELSAFKADEVKAFMQPVLARSPVEVVIVGDVTVDQAIESVAKTFGTLPSREQRSVAAGAREVRFPAATPEPIAMTHKGRPDQGLAVVAWPVPGSSDAGSVGTLRLLQLVFNERLFERIRAKEGRTYTPMGDLVQEPSFPNYGYMTVMLETPPDQIPGVFTAIDEIAADIAANGVTADELDRARKPRIEFWNRTLRTNGFWSTTLANLHQSRTLYDQQKDPIPRLTTVTAQDIQQAAAAYLVKEKAWRVMVAPERAAATASR